MNAQEPNQAKLESWKEIAGYLQRDVKTAQRWEKEEGLPIHRHNHNSRSSVYAYPEEIEAWRATRKSAAGLSEPAAASRNPFWRFPAFAVAILLCLMMMGDGIHPQVAAAEQGAKRVLVPKRHISYETISPDGQWLGGTDWETGDLVLTRVSSGETKRRCAVHSGTNRRAGLNLRCGRRIRSRLPIGGTMAPIRRRRGSCA